MDQQQKNRILIFGTIALSIVCAGALCLAITPAIGVLAMRRISAANISIPSSTSESITPTPHKTEPVSHPTSTPIPTASRTPVISQTLSITTILPTQTEIAGSQFPTQPTIDVSATPESLPTSLPIAMDTWCVPWNSRSYKAYVIKAIDGVTIEVSYGGGVERIGYIGVDLLEYANEPAVWAAMTEKNKSLVEGKQVLLIEGDAGLNESDLPLRYVLVGDTFVNLEMIQSGYAIARSTPPYKGCDTVFSQAETDAITSQRGLWAPNPTPTRTLIPPTPTISAIGDIVIVKVAFLGTPWREPDEFVEIYNSGTQRVQLEGWSLSDSQRHVFIFPKFVLGSNQYCRVYTDQYQPQNCGFSYFKPSPVWDNGGDCAYLKDSTGRLVDTFCYE
jgi:endonuclease YncB( thermonuclease family)